MREFDRAIGRAWRRMRLQRFLSALVWCWCGTLLVASFVIAIDKFGVPIPGHAWAPIAVAGGVGLALAVFIALFTGPSRLDAAQAIDRVFGLNERLATAITLPEHIRKTPVAIALVDDAKRHVGRLDIGSQFGVRIPRRAWLPVLIGGLAVGLLFAPDVAQTVARARTPDKLDQKLLVEQTKTLGKSIAKKRKELDTKDFAEAEALLAKIEKAADELSKAPPAGKDKALMRLNTLTDALKDRKKQLAGADQVNKQLQMMKQSATSGPADDFSRELAKGDFEKAAQELKKLQEKLAAGKMTESDKKALLNQVQEMKKELEKMSNLEQRRKQLEEARKNGGISEKQFQEESAKLDRQAENLKQMKQLAQALQKCENGMKAGDMKQAAEALGMGQEQLNDLAKQMQELQTLDDAMADVQDAKNGVGGDFPNKLGEGMPGGMNGMGDRQGMGKGLGRGRGKGDRPEAPDDTAAYDTKVKQQIGKGKAIFEGFAPPRGMTKGASRIEIQQTLEAESAVAADSLTNQKIPNAVRKHIKGYFDQVKEGR